MNVNKCTNKIHKSHVINHAIVKCIVIGCKYFYAYLVKGLVSFWCQVVSVFIVISFETKGLIIPKLAWMIIGYLNWNCLYYLIFFCICNLADFVFKDFVNKAHFYQNAFNITSHRSVVFSVYSGYLHQ